jgi:diguanylate cyclase (GGDEF)-like protein/PAS domain S-box-containing protein
LKPDAAVSNHTPAIHFRAAVTYYDSVAPNLFVQDASGGTWVDLRGVTETPPRPGQLLDLRGYAGVGFAPYIAQPQWRVLGTSALPKPIPVDYQQASTGVFDGQFVEIEGVVRSFLQQSEGSVLVIDVATPSGAFKVRIPDYHDGFPMQLIDARVRFRGVCGTAFNRRNQIVAIHIFVNSLKNSAVLEPAPADPFNIEATSISDVGRFSSNLSDVHRLKVVGIITALFPQRGLFLMDSTGGLYAESQDGTSAQPGDEVEVIGFPATGGYAPVLRSARFRPTGKHSPLVPSVVTGHSALSGEFDGQLVNISGTVRSYRQRQRESVPIIESDDHTAFEADLHANGDWLGEIGSKVSLTGVCSIRADENGNPSEFRIVLRGLTDVKILNSPPWMNARRAVLLSFSLTMSTLFIVGWVVVLKRRVKHQTEVIRLKLENEIALENRYRNTFERNLTGLYISQPDGSIVDCNESCAKILGFESREQLLADRVGAGQIAKAFWNGSAQTEIVNAEYRFKRNDGSFGWVLSNARVQHKGDGETVIEGGLVDITDRKTAEQQIQFLAYYDSLTGVANRTLFQDRLAKAIASARRHKERVAVLFLDLDRFKNINDSLGHTCGDLILTEVALRLQTCAREQDTVARLGGDEFVLVLGSVKAPADAAVAAERVARAVSRDFEVQGRVLSVTCSIGISLYPEHGEDPETLIKHADAALYSSKENGRNTFRFFAERMNAETLERLTLETNLRSALERQQLFLAYQPEIAVSDGRITCCEALVRWEHPELGSIPPDKFIGIAESSGMIVPIGEWVLTTACSEARKWQEQSGAAVPVAVNVSAVQFRQEGFCETIRRVLEDTGLEPRYLELELTETLLLSNEDVMFDVLAELKRMGVRLAIDDFGTGYSSLNYLKQLPVSKLKIDRSFVRDLAQGSRDVAITAAIINVAKCLNLTVTAEGVEEKSQLSVLREYSCDEVQGFLFGKPMTAPEITDRLRDHASLLAMEPQATGSVRVLSPEPSMK